MSFESTAALTMVPVSAAVNQYRFMALTAGEVDEALAGVDIVGVSLEASAASEQTPISMAMMNGAKCTITAGAAFAAGASLESDATGRAVSAAGNESVVAYALEAAGGAGDQVTIMLVKAGASSKPATHWIVAAGSFTTVGGDAAEIITPLTGVLATDIAFVQLHTEGATPVTVDAAAAGTGDIDVTMSADPSTDHVLSYQVLRAV